MTYLLRYDILQQCVTYLLRYDILQQCVTYLYCEMTYCSNVRHIYRTWEQLAPLGCFLFVDLFRYHKNVKCFESLEREYTFAPFLLAIRIFSQHFNYWNQCRMKSSTATCSWCMSDSLRHWEHTGSYHSWGFHLSREYLSGVREEF